MTFPEILRYVSMGLGVLTALCYSYQVLYLFAPLFLKKQRFTEGMPHRYAILIAARNEEQVLPYLLESIQAQDYPSHLITTYVVADNCTDRTAQVAQAGGAVCFVRNSETQKGKGYALNYLLNKIRTEGAFDRYDAFLVFDADNLLMPDYITAINKACTAGYDVFCGFRNSKNFGTNWVSAGHSLWFLHDSVHLNQGRMWIHTPCMVTGTGFGFTRALLEKCGGWNFFTLTEDIEFSTWCVIHGVRVGCSQEAELFDEQPERFSQSWRQRTRWVQGGIQVSLRYGKQLLRGMCKGGRAGYACMETATLSLWGYSLGILCGILAMASAFLDGSWNGLLVTAIAGLLSAFAGAFLMGVMTLLVTWNRIRASTGQKLMSLMAFPLYMLSYIPIGVTAVFRKFHWPPIEHRASVSHRELCQQYRE